jgi:L-alanine-DL-glutamate epimerase-like enolase superfamily enzyme
VSRRLLWLSIPLRRPFVTARASLTARELVVLRVERGGIVAHGEAAPFEPYDGVSLSEVAEVMATRKTRGFDDPNGSPHVHAADEMAFLDLEGRRLGIAAVQHRAREVDVSAVVAGATVREVAEAAEAAAAAGYGCVKLKVGLDDDPARVAAVRDAVGSDALLRLDANGVWDVDTAATKVAELAEFGIEFLEQPCASLEELAWLRDRCEVRIAAEVSVQSAADVEAAAALGACDVIAVVVL